MVKLKICLSGAMDIRSLDEATSEVSCCARRPEASTVHQVRAFEVVVGSKPKVRLPQILAVLDSFEIS